MRTSGKADCLKRLRADNLALAAVGHVGQLKTGLHSITDRVRNALGDTNPS